MVKQSDLLVLFIQSETLIGYKEGFETLLDKPFPLDYPFPFAFLTLFSFLLPLFTFFTFFWF